MTNSIHNQVIIFDGVCNFCNFYINFILKIDKKNKFKFATLQSDFGKEIVRKFNIKEIDSVIFFADNKVFVYSNAILEIIKKTSFPYYFLYVLLIIFPTFVRDYLYKLIAKNRYAIFGKSNQCRIPTKNEIEKFITNKY
ncbi:MAG: DUF393 domain-containing protein [Cytophagales bacterium]|nr:MAG: DUF393 domain-containing protein [Cytophagales bacterium]